MQPRMLLLLSQPEARKLVFYFGLAGNHKKVESLSQSRLLNPRVLASADILTWQACALQRMSPYGESCSRVLTARWFGNWRAVAGSSGSPLFLTGCAVVLLWIVWA